VQIFTIFSKVITSVLLETKQRISDLTAVGEMPVPADAHLSSSHSHVVDCYSEFHSKLADKFM